MYVYIYICTYAGPSSKSHHLQMDLQYNQYSCSSQRGSIQEEQQDVESAPLKHHNHTTVELVTFNKQPLG
jgi:hypothetical protein